MKRLIALILFALTLNAMACECIPGIETAVIDSSGTVLTVTFNKPMTDNGKGDGWLYGQFGTRAIQHNGGDGTDTWTFDIAVTVLSTNTFDSFSVNDEPIDSFGYHLLPFTGEIENDSTQ